MINLANSCRSIANGPIGISFKDNPATIKPQIQSVSRQNHLLIEQGISTSKTVPIRALSLEYKQFLQERPLSGRELEILRLIVQGRSTNEMAQVLHLTDGTVKSHVRNILYKLGVRDRTQAAVLALRAGLAD